MVLVLVLGVVTGISLIQTSKQLTSKASQSGGPSLLFSPKSQANLVKDGEFYVDLALNTDNNLISGVDIEVRYSDNFRLVEFRADPGSGLETVVIPGMPPDNYTNVLRFAAVNKTGNIPVRGAIKLGDMKFKAVKNGTGKVTISNAKLVIANQEISMTPGFDIGEYTVGGTSDPGLPPNSPSACIDGDADGNGCVDANDYNIWKAEYFKTVNTKKADFYPVCSGASRGDGSVDIVDFAVWLKESTVGSNRCK